jgi:YgiT-type zinc finger domain-containing protein
MMMKPKIKRPDISTLAADACPACGTTMRERRARLTFPVNGENVPVPAAAHLRCPNCGEVVLRLDHMRHLRESALAIYRAR